MLVQVLITGVAGFVGSQVARECLAAGWTVCGVDCFRPYYDIGQKRLNLVDLLEHDRFAFHEADLSVQVAPTLLTGVDVVFHLAGQPGVRSSWQDFATYCDDNILATQLLLEAARDAGVRRFVYSSSSSVYGDADAFPAREDALPSPISPYGVSKLAGEHLCLAYAARGAFEAVALRYFTVYGPRQRPDMAIHRLIQSALTGSEFPMFGDGSQIRDFTYVGDVARANRLAAEKQLPQAGLVLNISGGSEITLLEVIGAIAAAAGPPAIVRAGEQPGDVRRTGGDSQAAKRILGWGPMTPFDEGIHQQVRWHRSLYAVAR